MVSWAEEKLVTGLQGKPSALMMIRETAVVLNLNMVVFGKTEGKAVL